MKDPSAALEVIAPGFHTTVQDLGRYGFQRLGVPVSGALDTRALRLVNGLLGNEQGAGCLEILYQGPAFRVLARSIRLALSDGSISVMGESSRVLPAGRSIVLVRGQSFQVVAPRHIACCYLAVQGGLRLEETMGSVSTYVRGAIGGFQGRALRTGDSIPLRRDVAAEQEEVQLAEALADQLHDPIRVVLGPQDDHFTDRGIAAFLSAEYAISGSSDRMGMRLDGPPIAHRAGYNIVSDAIATGAIQVPGSGLPVVLLADRQTTGGYPKIGAVISADLPAVGRRRIGSRIRFQAVTLTEARSARAMHEDILSRAIETVVPAVAGAELDLTALYSANLVSGAVAESLE